MTKTVSLTIVALAVSAGAVVAGDIAAGETVFKKCMTCHSKLGETAQNMIGPLLNGLKGRKSGSVPGFSYSDANKNSGIVWDEGTFKEYIKDPKAKIPGTKMVFPGIKNEKEIDDYGASSSSLDRMARRSEQFSPSIPNARHIKSRPLFGSPVMPGGRESVNNQPVRE